MARSSLSDTLITGSYYIGLEQDIASVKPSISEADVLQIAQAHVKKHFGIMSDLAVENLSSRLVVNNYAGIAKLVYIVDFFFDNKHLKDPSRPNIYIDAHTGEVLEMLESLNTNQHIDATGPGGNIKTGKYYFGTDYGYLIARQENNQCYMDSPNTTTYDYQHKADLSHRAEGGIVHKFTCSENSYKEYNNAYSAINDVHYFSNVVYDMYQKWYDTAPLNFKLESKVHVRRYEGRDYDQAYWNGKYMAYGDGETLFYPMVSLDIVGHEVSHGFTEQHSNLRYGDPMPDGSTYGYPSGGINEAYSDIAGEAAKYYLAKAKGTPYGKQWLVGSTVVKDTARIGEALRYFADPTRDGRSIKNARYYTAGMDPHLSSGIFNYTFYLLANTDGWDVSKAFHIFLLANQIYWTPNISFDEGGCGVKKAAKDLGYKVSDVVNAFQQAGVDATCGVTDPEDPTDPTDPATAEALVNGITKYGISGSKSKLFYLDVNRTSFTLVTWLWDKAGLVNTRVAYNRVPTASDNDCDTKGQFGSICYIYSPQVGRYYIEIYSESDFNDIAFWGYY